LRKTDDIKPLQTKIAALQKDNKELEAILQERILNTEGGAALLARLKVYPGSVGFISRFHSPLKLKKRLVTFYFAFRQWALLTHLVEVQPRRLHHPHRQ
jgi:hypothetical protein